MSAVAEPKEAGKKRPKLDGRTREIAVDDVSLGDRIRKDLGDLDELVASIERHGLIHPIAILADGTLIAGCRRLEAYRRLERSHIPARVVDLSDPVAAEIDENEQRLDFSPLEVEAIRRLIEQRDGDALRLRQRAGLRQGDELVSASCTDGTSAVPPVAERTAAITGVSPRQVKKIKEVAAAAAADPETFGPIAEEMDRTRKVDPAYRKAKNAKKSKAKSSTSKSKPAPEPTETATTEKMKTILAKFLAAIGEIETWAEEIEQRLDEVSTADRGRVVEAIEKSGRVLEPVWTAIQAQPEAAR
jgi:ParB-like chromosome segregation protein Spo0J